MNFKGSGPVLFVLLAVVFIVGTYAADYQTFRRQHYDNPRSNVGNRYCNTMMQRRGMTRPNCKGVNSFVHGSKRQLIDVCGRGGRAFGNNLRRSNRRFSVTTCRLTGGSSRPPCNYRENRSNRFIVIACRGGRPVHFDESLI
uniref:Ribonuclease A-domain domain-containing protein n=1 Tax=Anolis carolinensis TaxID=28377 RepID=A0A803TL43_ANOCA